jgi:hypothetical protein
VAIHEPQHQHLTVDELAELKGIKEPSAYVVKAKRTIHLMVLFAEYVEYVRDNVGTCLRKTPKRKHRSVFKMKELSIGKELAPMIAHPRNFKRFYDRRKPVINIKLYQLLNTLGDTK